MSKKAFFFIDDVIWVFRDLTRQRPASAFDNPFLKMLKDTHDKYDIKVQLNVFYQTDVFYGNDKFNLSEMTDAYKAEFEAASDWLKFAFHARQEFPDYPYINASYDHVYEDFKAIEKEVLRFAGEKSFSKATTPHWRPISKEACLALRDCGMKLLSATYGDRTEYNGDASSLPYGHAARLMCNKKPETGIFIRKTHDVAISKSLCGYNHITEEQREATLYNLDVIVDEETGLKFKDLGNIACVDHVSAEEFTEIANKVIGAEFLCCDTHEQYFYPDYFNYQPDFPEKIMNVGKVLHEAGYEFMFSQDL